MERIPPFSTMREVIQISIPKEPALFRTNPFIGKEIKETPFSKWSRLDFCLYLEDEDDEIQKAMTRSLNKVRKTHQECLAQDVEAQEPSSTHGFGRGFASGRGQPIPSRWFLLGGSKSMVGSGKTTTRKANPTSKAEKSHCGKLKNCFRFTLAIIKRFLREILQLLDNNERRRHYWHENSIELKKIREINWLYMQKLFKIFRLKNFVKMIYFFPRIQIISPIVLTKKNSTKFLVFTEKCVFWKTLDFFCR